VPVSDNWDYRLHTARWRLPTRACAQDRGAGRLLLAFCLPRASLLRGWFLAWTGQVVGRRSRDAYSLPTPFTFHRTSTVKNMAAWPSAKRRRCARPAKICQLAQNSQPGSTFCDASNSDNLLKLQRQWRAATRHSSISATNVINGKAAARQA